MERISQIRVQMAIELRKGCGLTLVEGNGLPWVPASANSRTFMRNNMIVN